MYDIAVGQVDIGNAATEILTTIGAISSEAWVVALVPWTVAPLLKNKPFASLLAVACMGAVNATATIAALVAGPGLGRVITDGFFRSNYGKGLAGAVVVAAVALLLGIGAEEAESLVGEGIRCGLEEPHDGGVVMRRERRGRRRHVDSMPPGDETKQALSAMSHTTSQER